MKRVTLIFACMGLALMAGTAFGQAPQTITFDSIPNVTLGDDVMLLTPSASSGLAVTLTPTTSNISISNNFVSFLASGHATINATQPGDGTYSAAPAVKRTFCINPPQPLIYLSETLGQVSLTSSSASGNQWFFNGNAIDASMGGTDLNFFVVNAGIYSLQVTIDGCISQPSTNEIVEALDQTITFDPIPDVSISDSPIVANAESTPGLTVKFVSLLSNATAIDSAIYLLAPGRATIIATQSGNYIFNPALPVQRSFCINPLKPTISLAEVGGSVVLTSSTSTGGQWFLNGNNIAGATGSTYTALAAGNYTTQTITADGCKSPVSDPQSVESLSQTIQFDAIPDVTLSDPALVLSATASSGLAVVYVGGSPNVSVSGISAKFLAAGHATITATQPGNAIILAAPTVSRTFCINPSKPTVTISGTDSKGLVLSSSSATGNAWYFNGKVLASENSQTIEADTVGVYTVQVTIDNCKSVLSEGQPVTITGIAPDKEDVIELYPNPAQEFIRIEFGNESSGAINIAIVDLFGRVINRSTVSGGKAELNISSFIPGTYLLRVNQAGEISYRRFVKY